MASDNLQRVRGAYEAIARGDVEQFLGVLDEQVRWSEAEHFPYWPGEAFVGPQAVLEGVLARIGQDFDDFRIDVERMHDAGDTVVVEARYRATSKATGRPLDAQVAHVWELQDGKTVRWQQYTDTWQFAQVTGVTPSETQPQAVS